MNRRRILRIAFLAATAVACLSVAVLAATPSLHVQRFTLASSGSASGGGMALRGSIGQPIVGEASGGGMVLQSGYWPGAGPGEPTPGVTPTVTEQATPTATEQATATTEPSLTPTMGPTSGPTSAATPRSRLMFPVVFVDD